MWGIIPAAGNGTRIQPLAFSKELLPVCGRFDGGERRPRAISDYLLERLVIGGCTRICFVISSGKSDILEYYRDTAYSAAICYTVQPQAAGLCDAIFHALPFIDPGEAVVIGLPDTVWFPETALCELPDDQFSFLLFPVDQPQRFDAVLTDERGSVLEIQVKTAHPSSNWIWGAFKMPGAVLHKLHDLWLERNRADEYVGTLVNAWLERGGHARAIRAGSSYFDVGTMNGYLHAMRILSEGVQEAEAPRGVGL
jgi:glucose-1-phosphate thymidylyltransferase